MSLYILSSHRDMCMCLSELNILWKGDVPKENYQLEVNKNKWKSQDKIGDVAVLTRRYTNNLRHEKIVTRFLRFIFQFQKDS